MYIQSYIASYCETDSTSRFTEHYSCNNILWGRSAEKDCIIILYNVYNYKYN